MGKITLTVEGTTVGTVANGGGVVMVKEVSETDSARLIAAYAHAFSDKFPDPPSIEEVLREWFDEIVTRSTDQVLEIEKFLAAQAAKEAVQPIIVGEGN